MILKKTALQILNQLDLLPYLRQYGRAEVVGSVALDLIVKLDLDIHLLIEDEDIFPITHAVSRYLLDQAQIDEVRLSDYRHQGGLKLGVDDYPTPLGEWSIDIWVTNQTESTAFAFIAETLPRLNAENRQTILAIKHHYHQKGLLRDGLSLLIYQAVLDEGINHLSDFENFRQESNMVG